MKTIKYSSLLLTFLVILSASTKNIAQQGSSEKCKISSSSFVTSGGSETVTYTYNAKNELLKEINSDGSSVMYTYDINGKIISKTETKNRGITLFNYSYDNNRLEKEFFTIDSVNYSTVYAYDAKGNLLSLSMTSDAKSYPKHDVYSFADYIGANPKTVFLVQTAASGEATKRKHTYEYDANGNILKDIAYDFSIATNAYVEIGKEEYTYDVTSKSVMQLTAIKKIANPTVLFQTGLVNFVKRREILRFIGTESHANNAGRCGPAPSR